MKTLLHWIILPVLLLAVAALAASLAVSRPLFQETLQPQSLADIAIAPPDQALSFARTRVDGQLHVLLVRDWRGGKLRGVDLNQRFASTSSSPLELYRQQGYDALLALAQDPAAELLTVDATALEIPFDAPEQNIGVGLNYREHAEESTLEEQPFLFPKFARPTRADSDIPRGASTLLDYEAELGLVLLRDTSAGTEPALGLVLSNEMTDRWPLVRGLKRSQPMGTTGFADGKSREGFAPIGPLLLVPRDTMAFYKQVRFQLYANGRMRQNEQAGAMLWDPRRIVTEVFARAQWAYAYREGQVPLLQGSVIPAGTIVFSGTPAGVIFRPLNLVNPWVYLQPGDEVVIRADHLGVIQNRILP